MSVPTRDLPAEFQQLKLRYRELRAELAASERSNSEAIREYIEQFKGLDVEESGYKEKRAALGDTFILVLEEGKKNTMGAMARLKAVVGEMNAWKDEVDEMLKELRFDVGVNDGAQGGDGSSTVVVQEEGKLKEGENTTVAEDGGEIELLDFDEDK